MGDTEFTRDQVDRAFDHVIDNGACDNGSTIHYSLVFAAAGLAAPQELYNGGDSHLASKFMEAFHHRCVEGELPPLDALIVHVAGTRKGQPGGGYFRINDLPDPFAHRTAPEQVVRAVLLLGGPEAELRKVGHPTTPRPDLTSTKQLVRRVDKLRIRSSPGVGLSGMREHSHAFEEGTELTLPMTPQDNRLPPTLPTIGTIDAKEYPCRRARRSCRRS